MNANERTKLDKLTEKVAVIEERQRQHSEVQKEIQTSQLETHDKVDRLLHYVIGDKETNRKGLVEDQEDFEVRLSRLEKIYLAAGLLVGTIVATQGLWLPLFK